MAQYRRALDEVRGVIGDVVASVADSPDSRALAATVLDHLSEAQRLQLLMSYLPRLVREELNRMRRPAPGVVGETEVLAVGGVEVLVRDAKTDQLLAAANQRDHFAYSLQARALVLRERALSSTPMGLAELSGEVARIRNEVRIRRSQVAQRLSMADRLDDFDAMTRAESIRANAAARLLRAQQQWGWLQSQVQILRDKGQLMRDRYPRHWRRVERDAT